MRKAVLLIAVVMLFAAGCGQKKQASVPAAELKQGNKIVVTMPASTATESAKVEVTAGTEPAASVEVVAGTEPSATVEVK